MLDERARFRPVAQILGRRSFWGRDFAVTGAVLDPRPETETLVAAGARAGRPAASVLDLGTGSGAILLTLLAEWPAAQRRRHRHRPRGARGRRGECRGARRRGARARSVEADWTEGLAGRFDLVVSNPPYIPAAEVAALAPDVRDWEPRHALTAGPTGLESYARLAPALPGRAGARRPGAPRDRGGAGARRSPRSSRPPASRGSPVHPDLDGRDRVVEAAASAWSGGISACLSGTDAYISV